MKNLFEKFRVVYPKPAKGEKAWRHPKGKKLRLLQRPLAPGIWEIYIDLGIRCCLSGGGGFDPRGRSGLAAELLMFDQGPLNDHSKSFYISLLHRSSHSIQLLGQVSKDYWVGFAFDGDRYPTEKFPFKAVPRIG